jgi:hypothetical protein
MGRRRNAALYAVWRRRWERFRNSGLTVAEFCRREGVSQPAFYQWRKRLAPEAAGPGPANTAVPAGGTGTRPNPAPFVEVGWLPVAAVEIALPNGVRVRVPVDRAEVLVTTLRTVGRLAAPQPRTGKEDARC